jgi:ribonuclease D
MPKNYHPFPIQEDLTSQDLERLRRAAVIAVDTELTGLNPHRDLLCLVQIADGDSNVNFLKTTDWSQSLNLKALLMDPGVTKIFHFAVADCSFFLSHLGATVESAYCTKIASKIARTYSPEHSLSALIKEFFKVELDKTQTSTDWLRDDLTPEQLSYAANDVIWLIRLKAELDSLLRRKGRLPTGLTYTELNARCQALLPTLVHLAVNGWDFGREDRSSVFGF